MRPDLSRVPVFYHNYIAQVAEDNLGEAFKAQHKTLFEFLASIPGEKHDHRYAEGKWTVKQLLQHMIDAERIFAYRALRFARKDNTPLPGFDEVLYANNATAEDRKWSDMLDEFRALRISNEFMFRSFNAEQLEQSGNANGNPVYVYGLGFIMIGHAQHHGNILRERYL